MVLALVHKLTEFHKQVKVTAVVVYDASICF